MQKTITITAEAAEAVEPIRVALGTNGKPAPYSKVLLKLARSWNKHHKGDR